MKKILIIEDNSDIRENTGEILSLANYAVVTAENGKQGVDVALAEKPDLIICDIMMPELDGFGVLNILSKRPETANIPFIFITAKTERSDIRKGMELGADDYLTKPFDDNELLNTIETRFRKNELKTREYHPGVPGLDAFMQDAQKVLNLRELGKDRKVRAFKKKAPIFSEGDTPSAIYLVKSGEVKTFKTHPDGKELITQIYKENDFFGFIPILERTDYDDSAVAIQDSEIIQIPKQDFLMLINSNADVASAFISLLCRKVAEKENQLVTLAYSSVRQRTAEALLSTSKIQSGREQLNLSREDLARIVGTASESVIRILSEFKDEGLISMEGAIIKIIKAASLEKIVRWNVAR